MRLNRIQSCGYVLVGMRTLAIEVVYARRRVVPVLSLYYIEILIRTGEKDMIEKFRNWKPSGNIKINYKNGQGVSEIWTYPQEALLDKIINIVKEYKEQNITLTARQLYYQLVSKDIIPNAIEIYKRITKFLTDARYGGYLDWQMIEDRGRVPEKHAEWDDVASLIESAVQSYRLSRWGDQDEYIELYCEKQSLDSVFKPTADYWHIYYGCDKGYSSASTVYDLAKRIKDQIESGRICTVLYFGDHDSSGLDMIRDIRDRVTEFLTKGDDALNPIDTDELFSVQQVALNLEQVRQYHPPPNPTKITDPRAKGYIEKWGQNQWEVDALNPTILRDLTEKAILEHINLEKYQAVVEQEKEEIEKLREFGKSLVAKEEDDEGQEGKHGAYYPEDKSTELAKHPDAAFLMVWR